MCLIPFTEVVSVYLSLLQTFLGIAQFVVVVGASIVIGLVVGMAGAFFTRFTEHVHGQSLRYERCLSYPDPPTEKGLVTFECFLGCADSVRC